MRPWIILASVAALAAAPSQAQAPSVASLYDHCEKTLSEGDAALLYQRQQISEYAHCLATVRAAYGEEARAVALANCPR